jgi:hypothetical protein
LADGELPARFRTSELAIAGAPALVCGTGYTGEDGVELLIAPEGARTVWDAVIGGGASPAGLGARDTLRLEVNYCLYGNDLTEERTPIEATLGWIVKEDTGFVGSDACRRVREEAPREILEPFVITGSGIPRQGNPILSGDEQVGVVTSGTMSPSLDVGIGMGYVRARPGGARNRHRDRRAGQAPTGRDPRAPRSTGRTECRGGLRVDRFLPWPRRATPTTFVTTPSTTGRGSRVTPRPSASPGTHRTRSAEVVFYEPADVGKQVTKDEAYAEVESVKAVSDVYAPLSGEVSEVNAALADNPEKINQGPLRGGLDGQGEALGPF